MKNKENFLKLVDRHDPSVMEDVKHRIKYRKLIRIKQTIILKYLGLKEKIKKLFCKHEYKHIGSYRSRIVNYYGSDLWERGNRFECTKCNKTKNVEI